MGRAIGIDLGTTNCAMAIMDEYGRPKIVPNSESMNVTPSVILFNEDGSFTIGRSAKNSAILKNDRVVQFVKRKMEVLDWTYTSPDGKEWDPLSLSGLLLKKLLQDAQIHYPDIDRCVVTVPAYFGELGRKRTKTVAEEVFNGYVLCTLEEPMAAAIAYGVDKIEKPETVMVYDLGGGTFDVTVLRVSPGQPMEELITEGNMELGGFNFDNELIEYFSEELKKAGVSEDDILLPRNQQILRNHAETTKIELSNLEDFTCFISLAGQEVEVNVTRTLFEELTSGWLTQTENLINKAMAGASGGQLSWDAIDRILLVGGSSKMPMVSNLVKKISGKEPSKDLNPDEIVAMGAGYMTAQFPDTWEPVKGGDEKPPIPGEKGEEDAGLNKVNLLKGKVPHSIGIEAVRPPDFRNPYHSIILPKGSDVNCVVANLYHTIEDNQSNIILKVMQGETENLAECEPVGSKEGYILENLPLRPAGQVNVDVSMWLDPDKILHMKAVEQESKKEIQVKIEYDDDALNEEKTKERRAMLRAADVK
jgi:molecular chaperone DnaK